MALDAAAERTADDAALVRAAQRGDHEAFGVLVTRHAPSILSLATRMLGQTADGEDVAQETFVAACRWPERLHDAPSPEIWLFSVARHLAMTALREAIEEGAEKRPDTEKRITRARSAVEKAIHLLET